MKIPEPPVSHSAESVLHPAAPDQGVKTPDPMDVEPAASDHQVTGPATQSGSARDAASGPMETSTPADAAVVVAPPREDEIPYSSVPLAADSPAFNLWPRQREPNPTDDDVAAHLGRGKCWNYGKTWCPRNHDFGNLVLLLNWKRHVVQRTYG